VFAATLYQMVLAKLGGYVYPNQKTGDRFKYPKIKLLETSPLKAKVDW